MIDTKYDPVLVNGIENFEKKIEDYASWIVNAGIRFQPGWALAIECPTTCPDIARACTAEAYKQGARDVSVFWTDPYTTRDKFVHSKEEYLGNEEIWPDIARERYGETDLAFISFWCNHPEFLEPAGQKRAMAHSKNISRNYASFKRGLELPYTITTCSNREWAQKIYPDLPIDEAYIKLWENLFDIAHIDGVNDPVKTWLEHCDEMQTYADKLNDYHFKSLHFTSEIGTDCVFNLPKKHIWKASAENTSARDVKFSANMPTEEVFCVPEKFGVNGKIVTQKTMITKGGIIDCPSFTVKDGEIVEYDAKAGRDLLSAIMDSDKNGHYLGEIAIVPYDTPISKQGIIYYNNLLDENSGCHTAIGNAYSKCLEGGLQMSNEELESEGLNIATFHEDCIFGTKGTKIVGTTYDGEKITIFENGAFTI